MVTPSFSFIITGPVFPPAAVEIGLELNTIRSGLLCGEGDGSGVGETEGSTEGLTLGTGASCKGREGGGCCAMLVFALVTL